eukprot:SAG31_NODE_1543_length_7944_cov_8.711281_2_plen_402_part_00
MQQPQSLNCATTSTETKKVSPQANAELATASTHRMKRHVSHKHFAKRPMEKQPLPVFVQNKAARREKPSRNVPTTHCSEWSPKEDAELQLVQDSGPVNRDETAPLLSTGRSQNSMRARHSDLIQDFGCPAAADGSKLDPLGAVPTHRGERSVETTQERALLPTTVHGTAKTGPERLSDAVEKTNRKAGQIGTVHTTTDVNCNRIEDASLNSEATDARDVAVADLSVPSTAGCTDGNFVAGPAPVSDSVVTDSCEDKQFARPRSSPTQQAGDESLMNAAASQPSAAANASEIKGCSTTTTKEIQTCAKQEVSVPAKQSTFRMELLSVCPSGSAGVADTSIADAADRQSAASGDSTAHRQLWERIFESPNNDPALSAVVASIHSSLFNQTDAAVRAYPRYTDR